MNLKTSRVLSRAVLLIAMIVSFAVVGAADDTVAKIGTLMTSYQELGMFNGSVLVATDGKVVFSKGFGFANMEWGIPNRPDTKFRLGSITKQFTSMIIMQLVEEDSLSLDATVSDLLPYFRSEIGSKITVHHLLTHTSGLPNYTALPGFMADASRNPYEVEAFVTTFCSGDLEFEPGFEFRYSNSGYFVLGAIIEKVTGESYEQQLRKRIFEPLEMADTGYDHSASVMERRAWFGVCLFTRERQFGSGLRRRDAYATKRSAVPSDRGSQPEESQFALLVAQFFPEPRVRFS